ncbi:hypothetical protein HK103_005915 [Boothiomyces macroporosus]|uniref:L domain-like protein n=1 Tax=Boothiomyces macroporosus TaxID=261099 RepID=A0AAD5ULB3_9FUNG|nr:hypothetical protein HK103_005915 [Boothiomyces macroporosus]
MGYQGPSNCCNVTTTCIPDVGITDVVFPNYNLAGTIPSEINQLEALQTLNLANNPFKPQVFPNISNLNLLRQIQLSNTNIYGEFPLITSNLLVILKVDNNKLASLEGITNSNNQLAKIDISNNQFTSFPDISSNTAKTMQIFLAQDNPIKATGFPGWLTYAPSLWKLVLDNIDLSSQLFPFITALPNLKILELNNCGLTGSITSDIGQLINLQQLYLAGNHLTGSVPPEIVNLVNMTNLNLTGNELNGNYPPGIRQMPHYNSSTFVIDPSPSNVSPVNNQTHPPPPNSSNYLPIACAVSAVVVTILTATGGYIYYLRRKKRAQSNKNDFYNQQPPLSPPNSFKNVPKSSPQSHNIPGNALDSVGNIPLDPIYFYNTNSPADLARDASFSAQSFQETELSHAPSLSQRNGESVVSSQETQGLTRKLNVQSGSSSEVMSRNLGYHGRGTTLGRKSTGTLYPRIPIDQKTFSSTATPMFDNYPAAPMFDNYPAAPMFDNYPTSPIMIEQVLQPPVMKIPTDLQDEIEFQPPILAPFNAPTQIEERDCLQPPILLDYRIE